MYYIVLTTSWWTYNHTKNNNEIDSLALRFVIMLWYEKSTSHSQHERHQTRWEGERILGHYFLGNQSFHALIPIAWLADEDSLMCCIAMMGRQIAKMFSTFSLWGSLFLMVMPWQPKPEDCMPLSVKKGGIVCSDNY